MKITAISLNKAMSFSFPNSAAARARGANYTARPSRAMEGMPKR